MAIKLSINGAAGRMGRIVARLASNDPDFDLVEALEPAGSPHLNASIHALAGVEGGGVFIHPMHHGGADVMIDFSLPEGHRARLRECVEHKTAMVSGTTGLTYADQQALDEAAKHIAVLHASNFSVGVALLNRLAMITAKVLADSHIEIVEMHHGMKADAPSGTAERLLEVICEALGRDPVMHARHGRKELSNPRTAQEIGIHSLRGGDVVGDHTIIFASHGERIELAHKASSRETFAAGALRAAKMLAGKPPGRYSIDDVLGL